MSTGGQRPAEDRTAIRRISVLACLSTPKTSCGLYLSDVVAGPPVNRGHRTARFATAAQLRRQRSVPIIVTVYRPMRSRSSTFSQTSRIVESGRFLPRSWPLCSPTSIAASWMPRIPRPCLFHPMTWSERGRCLQRSSRSCSQCSIATSSMQQRQPACRCFPSWQPSGSPFSPTSKVGRVLVGAGAPDPIISVGVWPSVASGDRNQGHIGATRRRRAGRADPARRRGNRSRLRLPTVTVTPDAAHDHRATVPGSSASTYKRPAPTQQLIEGSQPAKPVRTSTHLPPTPVTTLWFGVDHLTRHGPRRPVARIARTWRRRPVPRAVQVRARTSAAVAPTVSAACACLDPSSV